MIDTENVKHKVQDDEIKQQREGLKKVAGELRNSGSITKLSAW